MREITVNSDFTLPVRSEKQIASNVLKGSLGNLIEWFDWYVYASFAIYFSDAFFPAHNSTAQLLAAAGVFAIGFFMRPLGSLIMGRLADRHGRRTALTISVLIMATGSLIIAFVPTYATIGIWSPLILIASRLLQGLSLGGEYGTSATYPVGNGQSAPPRLLCFLSIRHPDCWATVRLAGTNCPAKFLHQRPTDRLWLANPLWHWGYRGLGRPVAAAVDGGIRPIYPPQPTPSQGRHPAPLNALSQADCHCDHDNQ